MKSLFNTVKAFVGGLGMDPNPKHVIRSSHVPKYMEDANVTFLKEAVKYDLVPRETKVVDIDPNLV